MTLPLSQLDVLAVDCQATAAAPRGHLLEMGWVVVGAAGNGSAPRAQLVAVPKGYRVPPAVERITGITATMAQGGVEPDAAFRALLADAASLARQPAPTVIHFARFEQPFLRRLAGGAFPLDVVCTHEIACRLLPNLPRRGLRALAGYFGHGVGTLRRSAAHVEATAFAWRALVRLLEREGVASWGALHEWLASSPAPGRRAPRAWPMPPALRLSLPDAPGVYRLLRTSGDVLYVGKASSLRNRVNSYFRHRSGVSERMLELLSQVRGISFAATPSALEAALLEPDEIKQHRPPYNIALTEERRRLWFAAPDLSAWCPHPSPRCPVGPFPSREALEQFGELARGSPSALGRGRWAPDAGVFAEGHARLLAAHEELASPGHGVHQRLLRLGTRLWREGRRPRDGEDGALGGDRTGAVWTPERVQASAELVALDAALARRRAGWLARLMEASVAWSEPGVTGIRLLVIEHGEITAGAHDGPGLLPPVPPGYRRSIAARRDAFTVARFDRLRVLTTELKRLASAGCPIAVRFGVAPALSGPRLASLLSWL